MATKLDLVIELETGGAVKSVKSLNESVGKLDNLAKSSDKSMGLFNKTIIGSCTAANLLTQAIGGLSNFAQDSIKAAMEAEQVEIQLANALREHGESAQVVGGIIGEFASQMQSLTGKTDEEIKTLAALAYNLGINNDLVKDAVKGAVGLTDLYGGSMKSNLEAIARAYQGNWRQVDQLIPEISNLTDGSDKLAALQERMAQGFRASTEAMQGQAGQLTNAKRQWEDFQEAAGNGFLELFSGIKSVSDKLTGHAAIMRKMQAEQDAYNAAMEEAKKTRMTYAEIIADEGQKEKEIEQILAGAEKTRKEIANIIAKDKTAEVERKNTAAVKARVEVEKSLSEILEERWRDLNQNLSQEQAWENFLNTKFTPAVESHSDAWAAGIDIERMADEAMNGMQSTFDGMAQGMISKGTPAVKEWTFNWRDANDVMQFSNSMIAGITDIVGQLGGTLGKTTEGLLGTAGAFGQLWAGIASKNPLQILQGVTQAIGGLIKVFSGDGIGEAIDRENKFMQLNKQLEQQLRDMAKELGSVHEATSVMLDDIIEQTDITADNFGLYANRLREILSDLDRGEMSLGETTREIGDAFDALISKAGELGTEGSAELLTFFDDLTSRGLEVAEVSQYMEEQLEAGLEGYKKFLEGDFSTATIGVFEEMLAYEKKVGENSELVAGVEGLTAALAGLSNTTRLTEGEFDSFEQGANDAFSKLTAQGFTSREALTQLAPMLSRLNFLNHEYGLTLDASTQALLEKAKAEGINLDKYQTQEEIFGDMSNSLNELVNIFRNVFPQAIQETTDAFQDLNATSGKFNPALGPAGPGKPDIQAASGFYSPALPHDTLIQAHRGEEVNITPQKPGVVSKTSKVETTIHLHGEISPAIVADAFITALRANTRGLKSALQREAGI